MKKNQDGITLIALVITIIVLLILAGVSIAMISGQDGILGKATNAAEETTLETAREQANLAVSTALADYYEAKYNPKTSTTVSDKFTEWATSYSWPEDNKYFKVENDGKTITLKPKGLDATKKTYTKEVKGTIDDYGGIKWDDKESTQGTETSSESEG